MPSAPERVSRFDDSESLGDETIITNLRVTGKLPAALTGRYICIGPNRTDGQSPLANLASGEGMVHAVALDAGRATYRNRCMTSEPVAPTNLIAFGTSVLAFGDGALAYQLDLGLDTVGRVDLAGGRRSLVADPKFDPHTGELHLLTFDSTPCQLHVAVSPGALTRAIRPIEDAPSRIRQLELTRDDVVLVAQGFVGVAPRAGGDVRPIWFAIDTENRHVASASGHAQNVVAYATGPSLVRWTLDRRAGTVRSEVLNATRQTSATTNWRQAGRAQRFLWTVGSGAAHKHDLFSGEHRWHDFGGGRTPGDLVYVADPDRSSTEDGGWLVGFVHDSAGDSAEFVVLDAENIERPAVATVHIPRRVPCAGRGTWIAAHESNTADSYRSP